MTNARKPMTDPEFHPSQNTSPHIMPIEVAESVRSAAVAAGAPPPVDPPATAVTTAFAGTTSVSAVPPLSGTCPPGVIVAASSLPSSSSRSAVPVGGGTTATLQQQQQLRGGRQQPHHPPTNNSCFPPLDEFAEDLDLRLGRANGNVYHRRPGSIGVHDGQIMVRLKKKRFIVIDYGVLPTAADASAAAVNPNVSCPPRGGEAEVHHARLSQARSSGIAIRFRSRRAGLSLP